MKLMYIGYQWISVDLNGYIPCRIGALPGEAPAAPVGRLPGAGGIFGIRRNPGALGVDLHHAQLWMCSESATYTVYV